MNIKQFLGICILLTWTPNILAQTFVGIKSGYTRAWPDYGSTVLPDDAQTGVEGFNVSLLLYTNFMKSWTIGIEPGVVQRGAAYFPGWQPVFQGDTKVNISMFEVPVFMRGEVKLTSHLYLAQKLGYGPSYAIHAKETRTPTDTSIEPSRTKLDLEDPNLIIRRWDHGVYSSVELGYKISLMHRIFFDASHYLGLSNIDKVNITKNLSMSFSLGFLYGG